MNSIRNVSFTQLTEHPYSLNTRTMHVSRVTVLGTDIVPEKFKWAESLVWKAVHCSNLQGNEVRNNAFQMEMTGTVRIFTRLNHSSSVLENRFYCAFKREYKHRRQATRE